ncbi:MAG: LysM peptidoglycan-binding domain-containing protein [Planctomycetota bacterium]
MLQQFRLQQMVMAQNAAALEQIPSQETYVVKKGDSLDRIARKFYGSKDGVATLLALNPELDSPQALAAGKVLRLKSPEAGRTSNPQIERFAGLLQDALERRKLATARSGEDALATRPQVSSDIDLVTRCIELRGEVDIKELEFANIQKLQEQNVVSAQEVEIARIKLRTVQQQYDALRGAAEDALRRAKSEYSQARKLRDKSFISDQELARAEGRLRLLERALK